MAGLFNSIIHGINLPIDELIFFKMVIAPTRISLSLFLGKINIFFAASFPSPMGSIGYEIKLIAT